jgi:hypothetical protein
MVLDGSGGFSCLFRRVAFFSLRHLSKGVFSGRCFAARCWFLPQGLQSEVVDTYVLRFALFALSALMDCWISRDEISRRGVMSRVCPDMEKSKFKERVRIGGAGFQGLRSSSRSFRN